MKNFRIFHQKTFIFLVVKFSVYLNRHVLVMAASDLGLYGLPKPNLRNARHRWVNVYVQIPSH